MDKPLLDEQCKKIFSVFLVSQKTLRFNVLHRTLNEIGLKMTKPTLISHLNHLHKNKLIVRKKEGKQNVSYTANWAKLEAFKQSMETKRFIERQLEDEKRFKSFPINEQVIYVTNLFSLRNLYKLKLEVQDVIDPSKNFEHSIQFLLTDRFFEIFKRWLLESCYMSKTEKASEALSMIDHNITLFTDDLFDRVSQKQDRSTVSPSSTNSPQEEMRK